MTSATATRSSCSAVDAINQKTMASKKAISLYAALGDEITPPERVIFDRIKHEVRGGSILDIGVGTGRTVPALVALSDDYIGIDYVSSMVEACRERHPHVEFRCADGRDLSMFADGTFKLVVFSCNGLCMVGHADRQIILREACRVLANHGLFVFSTYNKRSSEYSDALVLPKLIPAKNPIRTAWRFLQVARASMMSVYNRGRYSSFEERADSYAVINDRCHDYATMLYYVDIKEQRRQLADAGFSPDAEAFDMEGRPADDHTTHSSVAFVARKMRSLSVCA